MNSMPAPTLKEKLAILSDAARYDASCASSGTARRDSRDGGLGSTEGNGICHAYAPDGRCISLLKILMTNFCVFDCAYCVNRVSSNVRRARFTPEEVVHLTIEFYRRNYIEGLFLSSGIIKSPDETMGDMLRIVRMLREEEDFRGYIHLKTIPGADPRLVEEAGLYADRLSVNVELPTVQSLASLAPEKDAGEIARSMAHFRIRKEADAETTLSGRAAPKRFAPAGQSTQMIVGADAANDATILKESSRLYGSYGLKRVYYSAFSPIPDSSAKLPLVKPPLLREHRLYQADWLMRFYGFEEGEITGVRPDGNLDLALDPKLAWALANRDKFPVDVQRAPKEMLLRVPGFGTKTVQKVLDARGQRRLRFDDLLRMGAGMKKAQAFVTLADWHPGGLLDRDSLRDRFAPKPEQLQLL
jgi:putative DNA modification/repair radical SAM protein